MFFSGEVTLFSYRADGLHARIRRKREGGREEERGREGVREAKGIMIHKSYETNFQFHLVSEGVRGNCGPSLL